MRTAFQMHVSGFLMKPVTEEDLEEELQNLRNPGSVMGIYSWGEIPNVLFRDREKHRIKTVDDTGVDKREEESFK